jgi:NAD(P)-dependent dehydrogenase (short-subunit alcohol dehydrogenase family)
LHRINDRKEGDVGDIGGPPRAVIVTGAASGIGRAAALRLARDGYAVACLDLDEAGARSAADDVQSAGGVGFGRHLDVSSEQEVTTAFSEICTALGPLHALVHSAGILHHQPALDLGAKDWRRVLEVNLTGTFLCDQAAARLMVATSSGGRIVNIASVHSQAPGRGLSPYDASKGGIWMLTRNLALELAPHRITVNAIGPGLVINTRLGGGTSEEYLDSVVPTIPLGRPGEPDDVAGPVSFLCSDDAAYVTGAMLFVDGGMLLTAHT